MKLLLFPGVAVATACVLAACSPQQAAPQTKVPTLATSRAAVTPSAAGSSDLGRPRERLDMTKDERNAVSAAYMQCLATHGYDKRKNATDQAARARAETTCVSKDPLPPWEYDASNPHASDFVHAVVLCLRGKGVRYVDEGTPEGGQYGLSFGGANNDSDSISKGMQFAPECEKEVAAKGIGR